MSTEAILGTMSKTCWAWAAETWRRAHRRNFPESSLKSLRLRLEGATDLFAVSAAAAIALAEVWATPGFVVAGLSAAEDCGCSVAEESELGGGVVCWAESEETKLVTSKQTTIPAENLIDKCPPVLLHLTLNRETIF